jgi:hypothetical protein
MLSDKNPRGKNVATDGEFPHDKREVVKGVE